MYTYIQQLLTKRDKREEKGIYFIQTNCSNICSTFFISYLMLLYKFYATVYRFPGCHIRSAALLPRDARAIDV